MANKSISKWWREPRAPHIACENEEEFRARIGEYTMRTLFETSQLALGYTAADERFQFDLETLRKIEALQIEVMRALHGGRIRRVRAEEDPAFRNFMATATRPLPGGDAS
jgi:hypothetical protein